MDPATVISGFNDDLISIQGKVDEELYAEYGEPTYVRVGDWKFKIDYDGEWHVEVALQPDGLGCQHYEVGELDEVRDYSEAVKFNTSPGARVEKVHPGWTPTEGEDPVDAVLDVLKGRRGFDQFWDPIDARIKGEIKDEMREAIEEP